MSENKVQLNPELTAIAVTYRNETCIADELFPVVKTTTRSFQYRQFDKKNNLTVPETRIGDTGEPNRVNLKSNLLTETVEEHALEEAVSIVTQEEAQNSINNIDIKSEAALELVDLMKIRREINLAKTLSNKENYKGNFKELSTNEKIDKEGNVIKLFRSGIKNMLRKPNVMVLSKDAFYELQENPYIVSAANKNEGKAGVASIDDIKRIFGINKILVGESIHNTSKKNDAPNYVSCWENDVIFAFINPLVTLKRGLSFGYKVEYESLQVLEYFEGKSGMKGADIIKAYMSYIDLITCSDCAFLFKNTLSN